MDANLQFWPKVGETVTHTGSKPTETFKVTEIREEFPCAVYIIRSKHDGRMVRAHRHELDPVTPPRTAETPTLFDLVHTSNLPATITVPDTMTVPVTEAEETTLNLTDFLTDWTELYSDPWGVQDFTPTPQPFTENNSTNQTPTNNGADSDLDDADLDKILTDIKPKSTVNAELWAMNRFHAWQQKRNLPIDLKTVDANSLAAHMKKFYAEVRGLDGKMLSPSTLRGLRAGLHRIIMSAPNNRDINILTDKAFIQANKMFEAMCKNYVQKANPRQKHHPAIEPGDLRKVGSYLHNYRTSPENLVLAFWFVISYNFARRGREGFREMTRETFEIKTDDEGKEYLTMTLTESNKNWQGGSSSKAWDYSDVRAYSVKFENEGINIVDVYKFYLRKLNPECSALFQRPKYKNWGLEEGSIWFDNVPMGMNKIGELMKLISKRAALSKIYSNHSVRATAITIMYQGGVDTKQICKITKHKSEETLKHYIDDQSSAQKRQCSEILNSAFSASTTVSPHVQNRHVQSANTASDHTMIADPVPLPLLHSVPASISQPILPVPQSNTSPTRADMTQSTQIFSSNKSVSFPLQRPQTFNFNVTGGVCHFNFHYSEPPPKQDSNLQ